MTKNSGGLLGALLTLGGDGRCTLSEIKEGRYMRAITSTVGTGARVWALNLSCGHGLAVSVDPATFKGWTYCPECLAQGRE